MRAFFLLLGLGLALIGLGHPTTAPILGVNDAPVLDNTKNPVLGNAMENDGAPIDGTAVGTRVSDLVDYATPSGQVDNVFDQDNAAGDDGGALLGIAIISANAGNGTWWYAPDGSLDWSPMGAPSGSAARLLGASARVYFQPTAGFDGTMPSALTIRAWDRTTGTNGGTLNIVATGGTSAFSTATDGVSITVLVTPVIAFRAASQGLMNGSFQVVLATPFGTQPNDVLSAAIAVRPETATITAPPGWSLVRRLDNVNASANALAIYSRTASSAEPSSHTWSLQVGVAEHAVGGIMAYASVFTTVPIAVESGQNTTTGLNHATPSITTLVANNMLLTWFGYASSADWTPPAGMTEVVDVKSPLSSSDVGMALCGDQLPFGPVGPTGTKTAIANAFADRGNTEIIALQPLTVNNAPVLNAGASPVLYAVNEDAGAPGGAVGTPVSNLVDFAAPAGQLDNVTDANAGAVLGIAITDADATQGTWFYSVDGGTSWSAMGAVSELSARLLPAANGRVYFQPTPDFSGTLSTALTIRAWDQTAGASGTLAATSPNGRFSAYSTSNDVVSLTVTAVNDAPVITSNASTIATEDQLYTYSATRTDPDSPVTPTWTLMAGHTCGGSINASTGVFTFTPLGPVPPASCMVAVQVCDNGSPNLCATQSTTVNITAVNDPPVLNTAADPTMSPVTEDAPAPSGPVGTLVSALVNLNPPAGGLDNVTDVDAGALTGLAIVMVNVDLGTAYYSVDNGTVWSPVGPVNLSSARTLAADAGTRVYFAPVANLSGGISPFAFRAWDQTTGTNGGLSNTTGGGAGTSAFSSASDELYMMVTAVNDAPQATNLNAPETYTANTPLNLIDIVVSDVDHTNTSVSLSLSNTLAGSLNTAASGAVTSTYNSGTGVWAASGAIANVNILLAGLTFTPATDFTSDFTIVPQVSDGVAAPLSGSKLMTGPGTPVIAIIVHVVLEGSYNASTGLMNGAMRTAGLVPTTEPYTALGYTYTGTVGGSTTPAVLAVGGADAVHDWVIVELRSAANPSVVVYSRAALLQRDGQVCDFDGVSPVTFNVPPGSYYLAVRHRNHLGAMTASAIGYTATPSFLDMAALGFPCYGTEAQKTISGSFPAQALWAGDVSFNGELKYTGSGNDRDPILVAVGSTTPNNTAALYSTCDVNLDGVVKYTGSGNDRDPILVNVGSTTPNAIRQQQLP